MISIRRITPDDTAAFIALRTQLDSQTKFMLLEPGERNVTLEQQRDQIKNLLATDNQMIFLAETDGKLIGYLSAIGGAYRRNHHNVHIVIGLLAAYTHQGIGTRLFTECEQWARGHHLHRLELTVMTHNQLGIALYQKMGFAIEGTAKDMLRIDDQYVDQHYMYKLLS